VARIVGGVSDDNDTQYRVRSRERISIRTSPATKPVEGAANLAVGSDPEIPVIPALEMPALASPAIRAVDFGTVQITVEDRGDQVVLVLPGGIRIQGSRRDAEQMADALRIVKR
jgi:hypothetical protein